MLVIGALQDGERVHKGQPEAGVHRQLRQVLHRVEEVLQRRRQLLVCLLVLLLLMALGAAAHAAEDAARQRSLASR